MHFFCNLPNTFYSFWFDKSSRSQSNVRTDIIFQTEFALLQCTGSSAAQITVHLSQFSHLAPWCMVTTDSNCTIYEATLLQQSNKNPNCSHAIHHHHLPLTMQKLWNQQDSNELVFGQLAIPSAPRLLYVKWISSAYWRYPSITRIRTTWKYLRERLNTTKRPSLPLHQTFKIMSMAAV